jgi:hypothetical protein
MWFSCVVSVLCIAMSITGTSLGKQLIGVWLVTPWLMISMLLMLSKVYSCELLPHLAAEHHRKAILQFWVLAVNYFPLFLYALGQPGESGSIGSWKTCLLVGLLSSMTLWFCIGVILHHQRRYLS